MAPTKTTKTARAAKQTVAQKHKTAARACAATPIYSKKGRKLLKFVKEDVEQKKVPGSQRTKSKADRAILSECMNIPPTVFSDKGVTEIPCSLCTKMIRKDTSDIKRHLRSHLPRPEKPFVCPYDGCGYSTAQNSNLTNHIDKTHKNAIFLCGHEYEENGETYICTFTTSAASKMYGHWRGELHPRHANDPDAEFWKCVPMSASTISPSSTPSPATPPPTMPSPTTYVFVREQSPSPSSSSCASRSPSPFFGSTATSITSVNTPTTSEEELAPTYVWPYSAAYDGGLTGSFSLHPRDFEAFLYGRKC
ncbi:hypothetical protein EIP86_008851 [Pleurotus ostreatoroseus]|nr:hypothetical protein EIP86_008851 [Pleurotus ostreatoroseus]